MLLHQTRPFCLQIGDLLIDIFDFLLDVIVVLAKDFFRRSEERRVGKECRL